MTRISFVTKSCLKVSSIMPSQSSPAQQTSASAMEPNGLFDASRYTLGTIVGRGSCGLVFAGVDKLLKTPVAIKKILVHDEALAKRTLREIQFQKMFNHANVLGISDLFFSAEDKNLFCVLPKM